MWRCDHTLRAALCAYTRDILRNQDALWASTRTKMPRGADHQLWDVDHGWGVNQNQVLARVKGPTAVARGVVGGYKVW